MKKNYTQVELRSKLSKSANEKVKVIKQFVNGNVYIELKEGLKFKDMDIPFISVSSLKELKKVTKLSNIVEDIEAVEDVKEESNLIGYISINGAGMNFVPAKKSTKKAYKPKTEKQLAKEKAENERIEKMIEEFKKDHGMIQEDEPKEDHELMDKVMWKAWGAHKVERILNYGTHYKAILKDGSKFLHNGKQEAEFMTITDLKKLLRKFNIGSDSGGLYDALDRLDNDYKMSAKEIKEFQAIEMKVNKARKGALSM